MVPLPVPVQLFKPLLDVQRLLYVEVQRQEKDTCLRINLIVFRKVPRLVLWINEFVSASVQAFQERIVNLTLVDFDPVFCKLALMVLRSWTTIIVGCLFCVLLVLGPLVYSLRLHVRLWWQLAWNWTFGWRYLWFVPIILASRLVRFGLRLGVAKELTNRTVAFLILISLVLLLHFAQYLD